MAKRMLFYQNKFNDCKADISATWRNLNRLMQKSQPNIVPQKIEWKSKIYGSPKEISNASNQHFVEIVSLLVQNFKQAPRNVMHFMNSLIPNSILLKETDMYEILHLLNRIDIKKSAGPNGISAKVLNISKKIITLFLIDICNQVLRCGVHPEVLKVAK